MSRRIGTGDAVVVGLGSMLGAGVFAAFGPAAASAGSGLLVGLAIAALVATCNALSSARLAARHPVSGGTYVYGRERLGPLWGFLAGWGFVIGKTASCAAMALTIGAYLWPEQQHPVAVVAVVAVSAIDYLGIRKSAMATRIIVGMVLAVLAVVVAVSVTAPGADATRALPGSGVTATGVLGSAGLLFFAFAGYARIATLGDEVRDGARTIPRAIVIALGIVLVVYAAVAIAALSVLGPQALAGSRAPLADAVRAAGWDSLAPAVQVAAGVAALGSLLALILGVSRTASVMGVHGDLPRALASLHPRTAVPGRATLVVGAVVALLAAVADLRDAIGFSSFAVLVYYAIANASAWTLRRESRPAGTVIAAVGLLGCLVLAATLPWTAIVAGLALFAVGGLLYAVRRRLAPSP